MVFYYLCFVFKCKLIIVLGEFEVKYLIGFILILLLEGIFINLVSVIEYLDLYYKSKFDLKCLSNVKMLFINLI